jgi:hypothetical protein
MEMTLTTKEKIMNMAKVGMDFCVQNIEETALMLCNTYTLCEYISKVKRDGCGAANCIIFIKIN